MRLWLKMKIISMYGSQSAFAKECGKKDDWVSRIVTGKFNPTPEEKELIASKLQVEYIDDLFLNHEVKSPTFLLKK
jgi:transcriptional regulator with XRE-family HTH domain